MSDEDTSSLQETVPNPSAIEPADVAEDRPTVEAHGSNDSVRSNHEGDPDESAPKMASQDSEVPGDDEEQEAGTVPAENYPKVSAGPYSLVPLIEEIPMVNAEVPGSENATVTCIESWEFNVYVGTSKGELLHFFKLDEFGFMLVSRQRISSKTTFAVKKIHLIPSVARALVLYNSSVSCFMMPEMSPANIGRIKDVNDITSDANAYKMDQKLSNRVIEPHDGGVTCVLFTSRSLRFVHVTAETIKLLKDMNYPDIRAGCRNANLVVVGTRSNYNMLDIEKGSKISLFPVSSVPNPHLEPIVEPVGKEGFLMTCGTTAGEPCLGMIVNRKGDVSRGTIAWETYPKEVITDYPHVLASFGNKVTVHSVQDQQLLQELEFEDDVQVANVSHVFKSRFDEIVEIIRLSPVKADGADAKGRIEQERQKASKFASVSSSSLIYGPKTGVQLLLPTPMFKRILKLLEGTHFDSIYDDIQDEIKALDSESEYGDLQLKFCHIASVLLLLKYRQVDRAFEYFVDNHIDPTIAIYLFVDDLGLLYEELWVYEGLRPLIVDQRAQFQKILQADPSSDDDMVLKFALDELFRLLIKNFHGDDEIRKTQETFRSVEVIYFLQVVDAASFKTIAELESFIKGIGIASISAELVDQLTKQKKFVELICFYKSKGMHAEAIDLIMELMRRNEPALVGFFKEEEQLYQFVASYVIESVTDESKLWEVGDWLLNKKPEYGVKLLSSPELKVEVSELKILKALNSRGLRESSEMFLQNLLFERNEIQFLGDLIYQAVEKLISRLESDQAAVEALKAAVTLYKTLEIPKLSFAKFLSLETRDARTREIYTLHNHAFNYILIATKDTITLTREKNVNLVEYCKKALAKYKECVPYFMVLLDFKLADFKACIEGLCELSDYKTAEFFAVNLNIPFNLSNFDVKIDAFVDLHCTKFMSRIAEDQDDEEATLAVRSTAQTDSSDGDVTQELLLQIFEYYLRYDQFKLIESFLKTHHLFDVAAGEYDRENLARTLERFGLIVERLPASFPVAYINEFLSVALIQLKSLEERETQVKNLVKASNKKLKVIKRDLQAD